MRPSVRRESAAAQTLNAVRRAVSRRLRARRPGGLGLDVRPSADSMRRPGVRVR